MRTRPYTLTEVTTMHETALSHRSAEDLAAAGADLGALAAATALRNEQSGTINLPPNEGLEVIANKNIKQAFETAFDTSQQVFDYISMTVPSPEQFHEAGVDFARIADEYEHMENEGLEPQLVVAPHHGSLDTWQDLYTSLTEDPATPLKKQSDGNGLWVSDDVANAWADLDKLPDDIPLPVVTMDDYSKYMDVSWTLRIIPGTNKPTNTNVDHDTNNAVHPTIAEYLTMQAARFQNAEQPVDGDSWTWLNGTFGSGRAPCGRWGSGRGQVYVLWDDVGNRADGLGSRLPVWGVRL